MLIEKILGTVAFVIIAAAFIASATLGWRALGVAAIICGVWWIVTRRIPYGIEGSPPSGHLTGKLAVLVGSLQIIVGIALFAAAEFLAAGGARVG